MLLSPGFKMSRLYTDLPQKCIFGMKLNRIWLKGSSSEAGISLEKKIYWYSPQFTQTFSGTTRLITTCGSLMN